MPTTSLQAALASEVARLPPIHRIQLSSVAGRRQIPLCTSLILMTIIFLFVAGSIRVNTVSLLLLVLGVDPERLVLVSRCHTKLGSFTTIFYHLVLVVYEQLLSIELFRLLNLLLRKLLRHVVILVVESQAIILFLSWLSGWLARW